MGKISSNTKKLFWYLKTYGFFTVCRMANNKLHGKHIFEGFYNTKLSLKDEVDYTRFEKPKKFRIYFKSKINKDFKKRLKILEDGLKEGKKLIIYVYNLQENRGTFRYRVFNIYEAMYPSKKYAVSFFYENELDYLAYNTHLLSAIVVSRFSLNLQLENLLMAAKYYHVPCVFDIDDVFYDTSCIRDILKDIGKPESWYDGWHDVASRMDETASLCNYAILTNDYLAEDFYKIFHIPTFVVPNSINQEQYEYAKKIKKSEKKDFIIGYFSGSATHGKDFMQARDSIKEFLRRHKDAKLKLVGEIEVPDEFKEFVKTNQIITRPRVNMYKLLEENESVSISVIPLMNSRFTNCKSELKFFESALVGVPSICSDTYVYKRCVQNGINSYLVSDGNWLDALEKAYENRNNQELIDRCYNSAIDNFYVHALKDHLEMIFDLVTNLKGENKIYYLPYDSSYIHKEFERYDLPINIRRHW